MAGGLFTIFVPFQSAQAFSVTPTDDGDVLANTILGSGITLIGPVTYTGASGASGTFTGGLSAGIGIDKGIILTTGRAIDAVGPNKSDSTTTSHSKAGDSDLDALVGGPFTFDANTLTFNFTTDGGDLFFNFVFASEEYNEYVNTGFNDVFGFFVNGVNIALIPNTSTPVAINTVNGGNPLGVGASNSQYYINNDITDGGPFYNIEYDGFTKVFTAKALGLAAGVHTIKLAIADTGDYAYDSAVFIQAKTFSDKPTDSVPEPLTILGAATAFGFGAGFKRKLAKKQDSNKNTKG